MSPPRAEYGQMASARSPEVPNPNMVDQNAQHQSSNFYDDDRSVNFDPNSTPILLEYITRGDKIVEHPLVSPLDDWILIGRPDPENHPMKMPHICLHHFHEYVLPFHLKI